MQINPAKSEDRAKADKQVGVLLPETDPTIGAQLLATLYANPQRGLGEVVLALIQGAPTPGVSLELLTASYELALCKTRGQLAWLEDSGSSILVGVRNSMKRSGIRFGEAFWPDAALITGPPIRHVVRMPSGPRTVWMSSDIESGAVIRQSEATAIGNAAVERFGGRVIEDRRGGEVMRDSFIEGAATARAKARAEALARVSRLTTESQDKDPNRFPPTHQRVPLVEAWPQSLQVGDRLSPQGPEAPLVFVVEARVNSDWVTLVAVDPDAPVVPPCAWIREDGRPPVDMRDIPPHAGFTDDPSCAGAVSED